MVYETPYETPEWVKCSKLRPFWGGRGRIVSCPLRVDQVQIIFLVFHTIQIQMRNTSWHPHAWFLSKKAAVPVFNPLFSVPNPVFWLYLCFQSRFSSFCFLFPIHVFCLISVPHPGFLVFCVHLCFRLIFFGLISVPNSGFLVFWIHLFSRFPIHISAAQSTAILRLITWVFNQKIRNYKQMQITKYWDHLVHQVKGWLDLCKALRILELLKVIRHVATLHLIKKDIICIWARKTLSPLIKKKKKSSQPKHCLRRTSIS